MQWVGSYIGKPVMAEGGPGSQISGIIQEAPVVQAGAGARD